MSTDKDYFNSTKFLKSSMEEIADYKYERTNFQVACQAILDLYEKVESLERGTKKEHLDVYTPYEKAKCSVARTRDDVVFSRNDSVLAFGKLWRIDHIDGSWISISNDDNEQKTVSVNILSHVSSVQDTGMDDKAIEDMLNLD